MNNESVQNFVFELKTRFDITSLPSLICEYQPPFPPIIISSNSDNTTTSGIGGNATLNVVVKNQNNFIVTSGSYTTTGVFSNLSFTAAEGNNYTIELYIDNICANAYFEVDDVFVSYGKEVVVENKEYVVSGGYRYGFNGMERDDNVKGKGNSYTTEFRQYDPRVGRWLSLDPLMAKYPNQSPYAAFNNNPIYFIDPTGLEGEEPKGAERKGAGPKGAEQKDGSFNGHQEFDLITVGAKRPNFFRRTFNKTKRKVQKILNEIGETIQQINDFFSERKRNYSSYEDKNKNSYETGGGIHGVSEEGQALENHKVLYDPKKDNEPKTVNYDELIPGLSGFKNAKVNRKWFDRVKKMQTSTNVADKAREAASEKMGGGSDSGGSKSYSVRDTVWRTETEQWWLYKKDTIIWDIEDGKTSTPRERTYHNYE